MDLATSAGSAAVVDRLLHHCDVISINGPSYRLKNRLAAIERDTQVCLISKNSGAVTG